GHDPHKVYAAYAAAIKCEGRPTVILAKTVKGYGMGAAGEAQNITHQQKKLGDEALIAFRDRFHLPLNDDEVREAKYITLDQESEEYRYLKAQRETLGGPLPVRKTLATPLEVPSMEIFDALLKGSGERELSTTMCFVRALTALVRDKKIGKYIVPIVPDEARTFGMEGMFRQLGIYSSVGQLYEPQDRDQIMYYREDKAGQILEEGINEAGAMSSWMAAATAYSSHGVNTVPFYVFYSMFGFQRIGDLAWAAGDMQARGFLIGGTAGRTTLNGEGLQHQDGHSHLLASTIPNCVAYDPCYGHELAVILHDGMRRMVKEQESVFYYITCMNENYQHPVMPDDCEEGIIRGMYLLQPSGGSGPRVQLLGSGTILREVLAAAELLRLDFGVAADVWSVTSFTELRRDGLDTQRWNFLHPDAEPRTTYVGQCLDGQEGPVVASSDYMKLYADQIRPWVRGRYGVLGTDGFGRSDSRRALRRFFEVDRHYVAVAALSALAEEEAVPVDKVGEAIAKYGIDADKPNPVTV
ncbi:MAG: pyruvate dehydrogenase (acetyl-transferring), homodimeric type, partial [Gammaproteobacteria bacterium]